MKQPSPLHRVCRWLALSLLALTASLTPQALQAQGTISAPTMLEVTAVTNRLGPIYGGVALAKSTGNYYVSALASNSVPAQIRAWRSNNSVLWAWGLTNISGSANGSYLVPTLSADGTNVYVGTELGVVYCLDATTADPSGSYYSNRIRWQTNLSYKIRSQLALSSDGTVLYVRTADTNSTTHSKLFALNAITGASVWTNPPSLGDVLPTIATRFISVPYASGPVVGINSNLYLGTATGHVLGFTNTTGAKVFDLDLASAPIVHPPTDFPTATNLSQIFDQVSGGYADH